MRDAIVAIVLAAITGGCAPRSHLWTGPLRTLGKEVPATTAAPPGDASAVGQRSFGRAVAGAARRYLVSAPIGFRADCSGFVEASLSLAGAPDLRGNTRGLWERSIAEGWVHRHRRPRLGDLVFFDDTWDRNRNGRADDDLTHIAVVVAVAADGTITMAHHGSSSGRSTFRMNLIRPDLIRDGDQTINDPLRRRGSLPSGRSVPTLASRLWRGFATPTPPSGW